MDDLEGVLDDAHGHELLAVVAAVHHQRAAQALDDRAEGFAEALDLVTASSVWYVFGGFTFDWYVVLNVCVNANRILDLLSIKTKDSLVCVFLKSVRNVPC